MNRSEKIISPRTPSLASLVFQALQRHTARDAIVVNHQTYTYADLLEYSQAIAGAIADQNGIVGEYIAIFGYRSIHTYTGILGALLAGYAYMPLNPNFPTERLNRMLNTATCNTVILSEECAEVFSTLAKQSGELIVICPDPGNHIRELRSSLDKHTFVFPEDFRAQKITPPNATPDKPAYLLFTSGSTGVPKGVSVSNQNVNSYLMYTLNHYEVSPLDRLSQMFDITFDLSVHDIFVSLLAGACLYVVPKSSLMGPAKFIKENQLTLWFSVPSIAMFMARMRMLKPSSLPSLRYSLFCGEALPLKSAESWQAAAPNSIVENLYGPTEATIAITNYRWNPQLSPAACLNGIVPIGWPFEGHTSHILDEDANPISLGGQGELYLEGPQITSGYLNNPDQTSQKFVSPADDGIVLYRTGDLVRQDSSGCLHYLGRTDDQVQIRGYRAELQEIDGVLRAAAGTDLAVSVPKLLAPGQAEGIIAFIQGSENEHSIERIMKHCRLNLPDYMVPNEVRFIDQLPLNANGKISRSELLP